MTDPFRTPNHLKTSRHETAWVEAGPSDGPLLIFIHGWPEHSLTWRPQVEHFARAGFRCVAPDMRGYGGSSVPKEPSAYAIREVVADMIELHDKLGGAPAVWVGHDWGCEVVWRLASHHADRCRAVVNLCVPYIPQGLALNNIVPLVDRQMYPIEQYPFGQWDYMAFYLESFDQASRDFEADVAATMSVLFRRGSPDAIEKPAITSAVRKNGGWFGPAHRAPAMPRDEAMLPSSDFDALVASFQKTGFRGADSWYMNHEANAAYALEAPNGGRLTLPVLFVHAHWDAVCFTVDGQLAEPMRSACDDLSEVTIDAGHGVMLERPAEVNGAIESWLAAKQIQPLKQK